MKKLYLVITEKFTPNNHVTTSRKGWHLIEDAWNVSEKADFFKGTLKINVMSSASVIIDLVDNTVIKCRHPGDNNEIKNHYLEQYQNQIKQALMYWAVESPEHLQKLKEMTHVETDLNRH